MPTAARLRAGAVRRRPGVGAADRRRRARARAASRDVVRDRNPGRQLLVASATRGSRSARRSSSSLAGVDDPALGALADLPARARQPVRRRHASPASAREWLVLGVPPRLQLRMTGPRLPRRRPADADRPAGGVRRARTSRWRSCSCCRSSALLRVFARERSARIDQAIELSAAYRGTALPARRGDRRRRRVHRRAQLRRDRAVAARSPTRWASTRTSAGSSSSARCCTTSARSPCPKAIVNKPGPLDDDEWAIMRQHTSPASGCSTRSAAA